MTRLFFMILAFWTIPVGFAQSWLPWPVSCLNTSHETEKSLKLAGFKCTSKNEGICPYTDCLGFVPGYPKPVLITIPVMASSFRLHFHGHKLGVYPKYEKNLPSMVEAFGLNGSLCASQQITIFPESDGKCDTYDKNLKDRETFQSFLKSLHSVTGDNLKTLPMHVSAHSGGGRAVMRLLNAGFSVEQVTIFDGTYAPDQKKSLVDWYRKGEGKLIFATVKGMSPDAYAESIKKDLGLTMKSSQSTIKGTNFDIHESPRLIHYSRPKAPGQDGSLKAHYDVLTETWPASR
jgi:hypothetical protein